jgi:hypothetical protein
MIETHAEAVMAVMDRLIEAGGGTEDGIAEHLAAIGVRGTPQDCDLCVLAIHIGGQLEGTPWALDVVEVYPNDERMRMAFVGFAWAGASQSDVLDLPPLLNRLACDFDDYRYPELEAA